MDKLRKLFSLLCALMALSASAQCRYCLSYEDFLENRWEPLDTVIAKSHSKSHQVWAGGNDFALKVPDKSINKIINKEAFAVKQGKELFVNCRKLKFNNIGFGNGYVRAMTIGEHDILFVNKRMGGSEYNQQAAVAGAMFGLVGGLAAGVAASSEMLSNPVCYIITDGAGAVDHINLNVVNDDIMDKFMAGNNDLFMEYYSMDPSQRVLAEHVLPILRKAGVITKMKL